jgi:hypothetical protein
MVAEPLFVEKEGALLMVGSRAIIKELADSDPLPVNIAIKNTKLSMHGVAPWGYDNQLPNQIDTDVSKTPVLSQAIYWLSKQWISGGLVYGILTVDPDGKDKLIRKIHPGVEDMLKKSMVTSQYLPAIAYHYFKYWNSFTETIRSKDGSQILAFKAHPSPSCRLSLQDEKSGRIDYCFLNAQWEDFETKSSKYTVQLPLVQMGYDPVALLKNRKDGNNFIYLVQGVKDTEKYYARAPWHSIRESKWLKMVQQIPVFKEALMRNRMTINYVIEIHPEFWRKYYDDWDNGKITAEEKKTRKEDKFREIENCLNGASNAGKNIWSSNMLDPITGKAASLISINPIDNKTLSGEYIEDSQEGVATILYSLGFDGTLIGSTPAKSMGGGSGSDKREAWNILITNSKPEQDKILEPLQFASDYNGFVDETTKQPFTFWFKNYYIQTLDQVTPASRQSQPNQA